MINTFFSSKLLLLKDHLVTKDCYNLEVSLVVTAPYIVWPQFASLVVSSFSDEAAFSTDFPSIKFKVVLGRYLHSITKTERKIGSDKIYGAKILLHCSKMQNKKVEV